MVCDWPGGLKFGVLWPERARDIVAEKRVISLKSAPHPDSLVLSLSVCPLLPRLSEPLRHFIFTAREGVQESHSLQRQHLALGLPRFSQGLPYTLCLPSQGSLLFLMMLLLTGNPEQEEP